MTFPILSTIVFLPALGAAVIALWPRPAAGAVRWTAAAFTGAALALTALLLANFDLDPELRTPQFVERVRWIPSFNVHYFLGVDGLSLPMVLLTTLLGFLSVFVSWRIELRVKEYFVWLLLLETGVLGVFTALDFLLFFLFWEVELIPMFLLISIWGTGRREYSAMKFLIYTIAGSAFMLVGILALYFSANTFDFLELAKADLRQTVLPANLIFAFLFIAYAIKLPIVPFHTWLPDAHTDAPTAVSVILAGVLLKMGGYAILRINVGLFPDIVRDVAPWLAALAIVNVLYGALITLAQRDLKRLIAYSSVSHMGYVLLGVAALTPVSLNGAALQMFTHGTITGLLFMMVGLTYDKAHTRQLDELGGLARRMPVVAVVFLIAGLASLGLPGMSGFVAEILVFLGTFPVMPLATILGAFGIVLTAGYILWMLQRAFFGPLNPRHEHVEDAHGLELLPIFVTAAVIIAVGLYPSPITTIFAGGIRTLVLALG